MKLNGPPPVSTIWDRLTSTGFLSELHKLLWLEPFMNRGVRDLGWSCRDHALIVGGLLELRGHRVEVLHGKACYVRGPAPGQRPIALEQALHSWLELEGGGIIDLSPNLSSAMYPGWTSVPFSGIANSRWQPEGGGRLVLCTTPQEYERDITIGSNAEGELRAIYLPQRRQPFSTNMVACAFEFVNSPLTDTLRKRYTDSVYAKAIVHLSDRLEERARSLAGVSRGRAWTLIAQQSDGCVTGLVETLGRD